MHRNSHMNNKKGDFESVERNQITFFLIYPPCRHAVILTCRHKQVGARPSVSRSLRPTKVGRSAIRSRSQAPLKKNVGLVLTAKPRTRQDISTIIILLRRCHRIRTIFQGTVLRFCRIHHRLRSATRKDRRFLPLLRE